MVRPETPASGKRVETWELNANGTVWVWIYDRRNDKYIKQRVGGRQGGSKRLRISSDDRRYNQEQVVDEMKEHDPFTNGFLRLIAKEGEVPEDIDTAYHLTVDDLKTLYKIEDPTLFQEEVSAITGELTMRRLAEVGETCGTVSQLAFVQELIDERWRVGGTQRTVREMLQAGEQLSGTVLT